MTNAATARSYLENVHVWTPGRDGKGEEEVYSGWISERKARTPDGITIVIVNP